MGQYTEHWARYTQQQNRYTIQLLGLVLLLPAIALLGYGLSYLTELAIPILLVLLLAWLVLLTRLALRSTKVLCPRCSAVYARGKYLSNCPQCGLRMLQEEPN